MALNLGDRLPEAVAAQLQDGSLFAGCDRAVLLLTVDEAGFPHVGVIPGVGARDRATLLVPCHGGTSTLHNLDRTRRVTVVLSGPDLLLYVKARVQAIQPAEHLEPGLHVAECRIESVLDDREPGAPIRSGITYSPGAEIRPHIERILAALRAGG